MLQLEHERIFRRSWQYVGHDGRDAQPASFPHVAVGDVPVVLVRDREDVLRAFLNVCRHRGSIVCEGSGRRETLQCPYHAWTYGLDGRLLKRRAPNARADSTQDELGLVQMQVDTWGRSSSSTPIPTRPRSRSCSTTFPSASPRREST